MGTVKATCNMANHTTQSHFCRNLEPCCTYGEQVSAGDPAVLLPPFALGGPGARHLCGPTVGPDRTMHTCRRPSAAPGSYCRAAVPHREPLRQARTLLSCRRDPRHRFAAQGQRCQVICSASTARGAQAFCPCAICSWSTPPLSAAQRRAEHSVPGPPWSTRPLLSLPPRYHPATARGRRGCVERMMRSAEMAVVGAASKAGHHSAAQVDAMPKQAQPPGQRHGLAVYVDSTSMVIVTSSPAAMASPVSTSAVWICRDHAVTVLDGDMEQDFDSAGRPGRVGLIFPVTAAEISFLFTLCFALYFRRSLASPAPGRRSSLGLKMSRQKSRRKLRGLGQKFNG